MAIYGPAFSKEDIREEETLEYALSLSTVVELKHLIDCLRLPIKKSLRKDALIDAIAETVRTHPTYVASSMGIPDIEIFNRLVAGETILGDYRVMSEMYILVQLGWIILRGTKYGADELGVCEMVLMREAEDLLRPLLEGKEYTIKQRIAQILKGWSSLCGFLSLKAAEKYIKQQPGLEDVTYIDILEAIEKHLDANTVLYSSSIDSGKGGMVYCSPLAGILGSRGVFLVKKAVVDGESKEVNIYEPKEFTLDKIKEASMPLFAPKTPNQNETSNLIKELRKYGLEEDDAQEAVLDCWIEKQSDPDHLAIGQLIDKFNLQLYSISDVNNLMSAVTGYMNTLPFWRFLGMSSQESMEREYRDSTRAPRLVAGPNMRARGMDIPAGLQEMVDQMWEEKRGNSSSKVGRNDPCPCGSGKKYKHCCGK